MQGLVCPSFSCGSRQALTPFSFDLVEPLPIRLIAVRAVTALVPIFVNDLQSIKLVDAPEDSAAIDVEFFGQAIDSGITSAVLPSEVIDDGHCDAAL
jgi:hypothetical protein